MSNWNNAKTNPPKKNGQYLCATKFYMHRNVEIFCFNKCLEDVDNYDFEGVKRAGWYNYDSEYGFYETDSVTHWMELPELPVE